MCAGKRNSLHQMCPRLQMSISWVHPRSQLHLPPCLGSHVQSQLSYSVQKSTNCNHWVNWIAHSDCMNYYKYEKKIDLTATSLFSASSLVSVERDVSSVVACPLLCASLSASLAGSLFGSGVAVREAVSILVVTFCETQIANGESNLLHI